MNETEKLHSELPSRLKACRAARSMTQREVAALTGIAQNVICLYENGKRYPSMDSILTLISRAGYDARVLLPELYK